MTAIDGIYRIEIPSDPDFTGVAIVKDGLTRTVNSYGEFSVGTVKLDGDNISGVDMLWGARLDGYPSDVIPRGGQRVDGSWHSVEGRQNLTVRDPYRPDWSVDIVLHRIHTFPAAE